ncbi:MAG: response regulator [Rhodospirillales bacterium]|jgi:DNA-binding response OmpR family regulator|nr:response regulator [Rhodospirillales bacterium]
MTRVLIIDDEDLVRSAFRMALERAGFEVFDAASGPSGLGHLVEHGADLVITDLIMPDKDGFETIREIRTLQPAIPIIAVTGGGPSGPERLLDRVREMGVGITLRKPISRRELLAAVNGALS